MVVPSLLGLDGEEQCCGAADVAEEGCKGGRDGITSVLPSSAKDMRGHMFPTYCHNPAPSHYGACNVGS
jgi:hypothetical protein